MVKFPDKNRHQVFVEPEGIYTNEMYLGGMSSSLPEDVQYAMYRTVPGLENVKIVRNAYAIEYDCINARQLKSSLNLRRFTDFSAAVSSTEVPDMRKRRFRDLWRESTRRCRCSDGSRWILDRSQAYIGVLIDDLVTKENHEPYRMMTSRTEYRLLLSQDNADLRLRGIGHEIGLISDEEYERVCQKEKDIEAEVDRLSTRRQGANESAGILRAHGATELKTGATMAELLRRPELDYFMLAKRH